MSTNDEFEHIVTNMEPGQFWRVNERILCDLSHNPLQEGTPVSQAVSRIIGAAWSVRIHERRPGEIVIEKKEDTGKRWFADADRMHYYDQAPDGSLIYVEGKEEGINR